MAGRRRYWGMLFPSDAATMARVAQGCEAAGLEGIWAVQLYGPPFLPLAAAAMATKRVKLGTGVALAFTAAAKGGDQRAMVAAIPDEMVATFAVAGTPSEVHARVEKLWDSADSMTLVAPVVGLDSASIARHQTAIVNMFFAA